MGMKTENLPLNVTTIFYYLLFIFGILFYLSWGMLYGEWTDVGVYSLTIIMVGFGFIGMLLYSHKKENK